MMRIPDLGSISVFNNLVHATRIQVARAGKPPLVLTARIPQNPEDWTFVIQEVFGGIGVPEDEVLFFTDRILTLLTTCPERRIAEYENIPWWTFIDAANRSDAYQTLLGKGLTRSLVAVRAQDGSTRTVGYTFLQLLYGLLTYGGFDRLLNGPTNDVWLQSWVTYLRAKGVKFCSNTLVKSFAASEAGITSVAAETSGQELTVTGDYYISALPVEAMTPLVDDRMKALAPSLANLNKIQTAWMNGIQYYLKQDVPLEFGHSLYADSPWALTSISQKQFWAPGRLAEFGDGQLGGILSVDISDWEVPGIVYGKPAMQCSASEIEKEAWEQIKVHVNVSGTEVLQDGNRRSGSSILMCDFRIRRQ